MHLLVEDRRKLSDKFILDWAKHDAQILHDTGDGKLHVENRFDCEPALQLAQQARDAGQNPNSDMKHIGEVPMWLVHLSIREGWFNDMKKWRRILNEYSKFKVHKD